MPSLKRGGGNRVFLELAAQLTSDFHVTIAYPGGPVKPSDFAVPAQVTASRIGKTSSHSIRRLFNIAKLFWYLAAYHRQSIIIASDPILAIFLWLLPKHRTYRFLQSDDYIIYDDLFLLKLRPLLVIYKSVTKWSYSLRIHYLFNSLFVYDAFAKVSGRQDVPCRLVHPGVNGQMFHDQHVRSSGGLTIVTIGRVHPWKGFSDFLAAWSGIREEVAEYIKRVYVISPDHLAGYDLSGLTHIIPRDDHHITELFNRADIFVSTSWWEGFGLPPLEAMACGCAVTVSQSGGVNEYARPGENCVMYRPKVVAELQERLLQLIQDHQLRNKIAQNGLQTAKQFTWEQTAQQFRTALQQ